MAYETKHEQKQNKKLQIEKTQMISNQKRKDIDFYHVLMVMRELLSFFRYLVTLYEYLQALCICL